MASRHSGNMLNSIVYEEHDGELNAKKVSLVSSATIYAVVDIASGETVGINSNVTLNPGPNQIGSVTISHPVATTFSGNVTLDPGSRTGIVGNVTLSDAKTYVGLVTATIGNQPSVVNVGNVTVEQGDDPWNVAVKGNVTLSDAKTYVGLVTASLGAGTQQVGSVTVSHPISVAGNVTLSDAKTYIGLTTSTLGLGTQQVGSVTISHPVSIAGNLTLSDSKAFIGLVSVSGFANPLAVTQSGTWDEVGINDSGNSITIDGNVGVLGNATLSDAKTYVGLVTATLGLGTQQIGSVTISHPISVAGNVTLSDAKTFIGLVSVGGGILNTVTAVTDITNPVAIKGNVTLSDSKTFIGLVTVGNNVTVINVGNVTVEQGDNPWVSSLLGNVTLSDSKGFIGLTTAVPAYGSNSTVYTGVISATGAATVLVAPASNRFFIKNIHVSSLGRSEVEIRSGATTLIPFTSLSTTSGYALSFGEQGLPSRAQTDALVVNLNGGATVSYMFNVRFEA